MADAVGSVCMALQLLLGPVEAHVMAAERLHANDTTVPVLAKGNTDTEVRSLARKLAFTCWPIAPSLRDLALGDRFSQAWKPARDTPIASHSHATGQMLRCFAMKTNCVSACNFDPLSRGIGVQN